MRSLYLHTICRDWRPLVFRFDFLDNCSWLQSFRKIVCSRHEHRQTYETISFVPTQAEADALEELDSIIARKDKDDEAERDIGFLLAALRYAPQISSLNFNSANPFQHPILRKVWQEYSLEAYRSQAHPEQQQLWKVCYAARIAGLKIDHLSHDQLLSSSLSNGCLGLRCTEDIKHLKSLELVVSDFEGELSVDGTALSQLRYLLSIIPALENLNMKFEVLGSNSLDFLPVRSTWTLRSLRLWSFCLDPVKLLIFLDGHKSTLRRVCLGWIDIPQGMGTCRDFLDHLKMSFGNTLEKFQISGMMRSGDGDGVQWLLRPRYDDEWNVLPNEKSSRGKELEDYVLRGGPWPMVASDAFPFPQ